MSTAVGLPHWDMTVVFPGLESQEFDAEFHAVIEDIGSLERFADDHGIQRRASAPIDESTVVTFDKLLERMNALWERLPTLAAYVRAFVATDSRDTVAQARLSEIEQQYVRVSKLSTRFTAWIGSIDVDELMRRSESAASHGFMLRQARVRADHQMEPALEDLAAEFEVVAGSAWAKLHDTVTSQIEVPMPRDNGSGAVPMTVLRNMAYDSDRAVRRRAYEAELEAWAGVESSLAAALNSIKGEQLLLSERRGWKDPLDLAVFNNSIDRSTLDAMLEAARASFPDFRRYLRAKARALGIEQCAWYDIFAPVGETGGDWEFDSGRRFLIEQFRTYSDRLAEFAGRAFDERWIDAEPRPGKVGGAFCMWLRAGESRVLANYVPLYDGVSTLAHELGHAYHNFTNANRTALQRATPMTLAETASIFCETIIREPALERATPGEQIGILEASIQNSCQIVVDVTSRFLFEQAVFARRKERELSGKEFSDLMLASQRETYGDGLDQEALHPYMWAVKGHYYGPLYYNYPYMFGLLFGLGLYAQYRQNPEAFKDGYDELLSSTGMADAATLAAGFGIDTRSSAFWTSSLDIVRQDIDRFEGLVAGLER